MNLLRRMLILSGALALATGTLAAAQPAGSSGAEIKRIAERYALTRTRINALLELRLRPIALPANPPNPFYQPPKEVADAPAAPGRDPVEALVPEMADISDIDTLRKFAATLKIGGMITRNGVPHLTINNTACKVGDIITVGHRDRPTYLKLINLSRTEFTLGLNDAALNVPLRK